MSTPREPPEPAGVPPGTSAGATAPEARAPRLCHVRVSPAALVGHNAAVAPEASAEAYAALLGAALRREFPGAEVRVEVDAQRSASVCVTPDPDGTLTLRAEGVARALRHTGRWAVYEDLDEGPANPSRK